MSRLLLTGWPKIHLNVQNKIPHQSVVARRALSQPLEDAVTFSIISLHFLCLFYLWAFTGWCQLMVWLSIVQLVCTIRISNPRARTTHQHVSAPLDHPEIKFKPCVLALFSPFLLRIALSVTDRSSVLRVQIKNNEELLRFYKLSRTFEYEVSRISVCRDRAPSWFVHNNWECDNHFPSISPSVWEHSSCVFSFKVEEWSSTDIFVPNKDQLKVVEIRLEQHGFSHKILVADVGR